MDQILKDFWAFLNGHDLPNWLSLLISAIVIPSIIYWWKNRTVRNIRRLDINILPGSMNINNNSFDCIYIKITNHTDSRVYLSNARVIHPTKNFPVLPNADHDNYTGAYILRFPDANHQFNFLETTLETNGGTSETALALTQKPSSDLLNYRPFYIRKILGLQKYFDLEFDVIVGSQRKKVKMPY